MELEDTDKLFLVVFQKCWKCSYLLMDSNMDHALMSSSKTVACFQGMFSLDNDYPLITHSHKLGVNTVSSESVQKW